MVKIIGLLLLCCCISIRAIDITQENCLNSYEISGGRPRVINIEISHEVIVQDIEIPMARHHIIPLNVLRKFFNTLVKTDDIAFKSAQQELFSFLQRLGTIASATVEELNEFDFLRQIRILRGFGSFLSSPLTLSRYSAQPNYIRIIQSLFAWMPFNIFEGPIPRLRRLDPGNAFEHNAGDIIGAQMLQRLAQLNEEIEIFNRQPTADQASLVLTN